MRARKEGMADRTEGNPPPPPGSCSHAEDYIL